MAFSPYLLILMRNDMASMSPGRAAAQASHATSMFTLNAEAKVAMGEDPRPIFADEHGLPGYVEWKESTNQHYGTAIVVAVNGAQLTSYVTMAKETGYQAEIVSDPSYGVKDGNVTHFLPIETCGYIFVNRNDNLVFDNLKSLPLY